MAQRIYIVILAISILANVLLVLQFYGDGEWNEAMVMRGWSKRAAQVAEDVAAIPCSGHGRAYLDGLLLHGHKYPVCECNSCYGGPDCSQFSTDCVADAASGDPYFLEPFWMQHASESAVVVAGWHRMGYSYPDSSYISAELEGHIRKLHEIVGNAVTEGRYIVFGAGSTHLLNAAVHALSLPSSSSSPPPPPPAVVVASIPYYKLYKTQTEHFRSVDYRFEGDASSLHNISNATTVVEFVTSPNNPDGKLNKAVVVGPNSHAIYDRVYYWPHFTPIPNPADEDIMIFSLSKLTGHAGSRFGWALIKNETVYERMMEHITQSSLGVSRDAQLRALKLINVVLQNQTHHQIFDFGYNTMSTRWQHLTNTLSLSNRFSLQNLQPQYCTYFHTIRQPSPAYAWVRCERAEDEDCYEVLKEASIEGRGGSEYQAEDRYVRLSLIRSQDDFDILIHRLNQLVSHSQRTHHRYHTNANNLLHLNNPLVTNNALIRRGSLLYPSI